MECVLANPVHANGGCIFADPSVPAITPSTGDCLPWIGSAWIADCPEQHYTLGWICCDAADIPLDTGGNQFLVFKPILDSIKSQLPIDMNQNVIDYANIADTEFEIDDKKYTLVPRRTPEDIIKGINDVENIVAAAAAKAGIPHEKAKEELYNQILKELKQVEELKNSVFNDDEEIIMILIAADAL